MRKIKLWLCLMALFICTGSLMAQKQPKFCKMTSDGQLYDCHYGDPVSSTSNTTVVTDNKSSAVATATVNVQPERRVYVNRYVDSDEPAEVVRDNGYRKPKGVIQNVYGDISGRRINAGYSATIVSGDLGPMLIAAQVSQQYDYRNRGYGGWGNSRRYGNRDYGRYGNGDYYPDYGRPGYYERYGYPTRDYGYGGYRYPNYGRYGYPNSYPNNYPRSRDCNRRNNRYYR